MDGGTAARELLARRRAHDEPLEYAKYMFPGYVVSDHHRQICDVLARVERGELDRVLITAPPRHGKSQLVSRMFPAWFLGRNPEKQVIVASYGQELASDFGRDLRNSINSKEYRNVFPGVDLDDASKAANRFHLKQGGVLYAMGVGGACTGRGFDIGILDDVIKNRDDADSATVRNSIWSWYTSTFYTRAMPGARIIIMATRWHELDLTGQLLEMQSKGKGDKWHVLDLPALADEGTDNEKALWPEWYPVPSLHRIRDSIGPRDWSALYQQRPQADDGIFFKREWFNRPAMDKVPDDLNVYITSDFAVSDSKGDYTVHQVWGIDRDDHLWALAMWRQQATPDVWIDVLLRLAVQYNPLGHYGEAGVIRRAIEPMLVRRQREMGVFFRSEWVPPVKDKPTRARSFQSRAAMGLVNIPDTRWGDHLVEELVSFPTGRHDDCVDCCSLIGGVVDKLTAASRADIREDLYRPRDYGFADRDSVDFWRVV